MKKNYTRLESEEDLNFHKKKDNYKVTKVIKWMIPIVLCVLIIGFFQEFFTNRDFKQAILGVIEHNFIGIVFFALYILGINLKERKEEKE